MENTTISAIVNEVKALGEPDRIPMYEKYFQCRPGGYGQDDVFLAVRIPALRKVSKKYKDLSGATIQKLLQHKIHEIRLLALFILVLKFGAKKTTIEEKNAFLNLYLFNTKYINNWDLVDSSAYQIVGVWSFINSDTSTIIRLAKSDNFWENRIAIVSTYYYIKQNQYNVTFEVAKLLLRHKHDIIHKGVGWMLREVGKKNLEEEVAFLAKHYKQMPRTMLRYSIEKFNEALRSDFLLGKV